MRTEVKVGLVIALVLVVVGLWFFVFRDDGDQQPGEKPAEQATAEQPEQGERRMSVVERPRQEPAEVAAPGSEAAEVPLAYAPGVGTGTPNLRPSLLPPRNRQRGGRPPLRPAG